MKKVIIITIAFLIGFTQFIKADEGMWLPLLINNNIVEMQEMGLKLSAEDIYSVNHSSLKDAIVIFGRGCTGEMVSPEGLLLTNHHCGYGSIQKVSTPSDNHLQNGFWATSKKEEIPIEGLTVKFLIKMEDASDKVLEGVTSEMTEKERANKIAENSKKLIETATEDTHYSAIVESFFGGNEFYLFVYETYTDVRLTGTPPESIGKFGADTDNWMWPRHTGDFSMFRVYADANGKPAAFSENNVPLKPKHFLPVSIEGVKKGDFTMIMGYPGSTQRYLSSYGVDLAINQSNMTIVNIRAEKLRIMKEGMDADETVRLQYASKYARTANYWKYFIGQTKGLKRLKVKDKKLAEEAEFSNWINQNPEAKEKYGEAIPLISSAFEEIEETNLTKWYFREAIMYGPEILSYANSFKNLSKLLNNKDAKEDEINKEIEKLKAGVADHFKDYNKNIDQNLLASMIDMYNEHVPLDQQPVYLLEIDNKYKGDFYAYAEDVFEKTMFADKDKVMAFLNDPKAKQLDKDPALTAMRAFVEKYKEVMSTTKDANGKLEKGHRLYIAGLREMNDDKNYYPDANFTMRLTYGTVQDYYPADAIHYDYYTTIEGIMEKEDPNNWEFIVPEKLKELYKAKDYGPYGVNGTLPIGFLTTHDITGGNSGSPVLNDKGELIGLAFDGNWEAMSGDIAFEPELQRTINVDIRYVMFIIDKFAGATNLIDEMTIVKKTPSKILGGPTYETEKVSREGQE
ncbi:MAG: S46 family peptidase [Bacteroidetes bacterium]|nr:S46 family peptidase [Bacteroidota bacterium]